ncbi:hypothetical protein ABIC10_008188 [Bradyrhizobium sp. S3.2.12]
MRHLATKTSNSSQIDPKTGEMATNQLTALAFDVLSSISKIETGSIQSAARANSSMKSSAFLIIKGGEAKLAELPAGVKVSSGVDKIDLGTHWGLYDKKAGAIVGTGRTCRVRKRPKSAVKLRASASRVARRDFRCRADES